MAEIILPPEENEETPQAPELNIDKPTENSKVITIEFEAKKTNKVSTKDTNQQLYTTDTDAWFEFKETSLESANGTYSVVFRNRHDGSIFQRTGDVVNGVAYYKIPHQEIRHAGAWRGQIVYTLSNGDTTSREFGYDVKGHILDGKDVREIVVEDFETLMSQLRSMKDNAEVELADLVNTAERNELERQQFYESLVEDINDLQENYQELLDTGVLQTNINEKLEALEEEYAPKLNEVTAQLAQKADKSEIGEPTQGQVDTWLANNPQATTTVQDNSVTLAKLNENISLTEREHHDMVLGNVSNVTGDFDNTSSRLVTSDFVPVFIGEELVFKGQPSPDKKIRIVYYHPDKSFKSGVNAYAQQTTDRIFPITENGFVKYVIWKGTTALTATEIAELPTFVYLQRNKLRKNMLTFEDVYRENTIPLPLQAGGIVKESGIITSAENATVTDDFTTMKRTGKYLRVIGGTKAKLEYPNGVGYVFEYDRNFTFLGHTTAPSGSSFSLRKNTAMIKTSFEGVTVAHMEPKLTYTYNGPHEWVYNDNKFNRATYKYVNFIYEVDTNQGRDILASDSTETQYSLDRHFNSALLRLPKNYDPFGKPTKLIIFVQGSGSYAKFDTGSPHQNYEYTYSNIFDYIIDEGYAVLGVYPWTTKYNIITNTSTNQVTPTAVAAYTQAYKWVTENFNIADNGVFVSGKSSGGFMGTALGYNHSIPVIATGLLAPVISPMKEVFGPTYDTRLAYAQDFGFEGDHTLLDGNPHVVRTPELDEYIRLNAPKTVGYNPYWQGLIGEDLSQLIEAGIDGSEFDWELNKNKQRISSSPIKIWCSEDDPILTYRQARLYIKSIQNAQGNAELRTMPNGTGGHASVDRDENALKVPNITTRLGVQYTNVATAVVEMIQYFRRFEN